MQNPVTCLRDCVRDLTPMHEYHIAVGKFDRQCLGLEECIEDVLKKLQRWEAVRRQAVKMVLLQFHGTLSNLLRVLEAPIERSASHIAMYLPDLELPALTARSVCMDKRTKIVIDIFSLTNFVVKGDATRCRCQRIKVSLYILLGVTRNTNE